MTDKINLNTDITTLDVQQKIELYRRVKKLRLDAEKALSPVEAMESALKEALILEIPKSGEGVLYADADGTRRVMQVTSKRKPTISDWNLLIEVLKKNDRFDLLQKRLSDAAVTDIPNWDKIPGIAAFNALSLSDTKI